MKSSLLFTSLATLILLAPAVSAQAPAAANTAQDTDHATAYYNYTMGHLYAEMAASSNRSDYVNQAIDHYRAALAADPDIGFLAEELSDLYIMAGRVREAEQQQLDALKKDPNDVTALRILARIYWARMGDPQQGGIDQDMLQKATEQYTKLSQLEPGDVDVWIALGRLHKAAQHSPEAEDAYLRALQLEPNNEDALIGLAVVYQDLGDQDKVSEILQKMVSNDPRPQTLSALARSYEQQGEYELAAEAYNQALSMAPGNPGLMQALAQNLAISGQNEKALKIYEQMVAANPEDYDSELRISQIALEEHDLDKAWDSLQKAKAGTPDSMEVLYQEINVLEAMDRVPEAIDKLQNLLDETQKSTYSASERANRAVFLQRLAVLQRSQGKFDAAVSAFQEMRDLDPALEARALAQIGDTYRQAKEFDKAVEVLDQAATQFPKDRMIGVVRATVLADLGRDDEAVDTIQQLTEGETTLDSYMTQAQIYDKTKRYDQMADALNKALEVSSSNEERSGVLFMQGAMYERQKQFTQAESSFRQVLKIDPENSSAMNYLGYMFADQNKNLDEALSLINKALELEPGNGAYLDSLGWAYFRKGDLDQAQRYLMQALEKISDDPVVHDHMGDVYFQQGKLADAITNWKVALQNWNASSVSERDDALISALQKKLESAEVRQAREASNSTQP